MTDDLKNVISEKLARISKEYVGLELLDIVLEMDGVFSLIWPEFDTQSGIHSTLKKARTKKKFTFEEVFQSFVDSFGENAVDMNTDHFVYAYLMLVKKSAAKMVAPMVGEFLEGYFEAIKEFMMDEGEQTREGSFFESLNKMAGEDEIPYYAQVAPVYEDIITTLFSEKSHVPIVYTPQDKLRAAVFAHIAHKFTDFDAPVVISTSTVYHLSAKSILSQLLVSPSMLMDAIDKDLDNIAQEKGGGVIIVDEVDAFIDSGENILLRRIYISCRQRGLRLILGSAKKPPAEYWLEPIPVNIVVDVEDCVMSYMKHMSQNYNLSITGEALELIKMVSGTLFSRNDFNSILRLIEKSAALVTYDVFKPNPAIVEAKRELSNLIHTEISEGTFEASLKKILDEINDKFNEQLEGTKGLLTIEERHVRHALKKFFGIEEEDLEPLQERMSNLEDRLNSVILGQEEAIKLISDHLTRAFSGLFEKSGPVAVFMALGSSGIGKTFTAKTLQKIVFGDHELIRLDMSEYLDQTAANKLLGSSAGYVGYEEGSAFFDAVRKNPRSVVLIDEVEKAHKTVIDAFLNIFEEGYAHDNKGDKVDFTQCIFILTGNIGTKSLQAGHKPSMGFVQDSEETSEDQKLESAKKELKAFFRPEFLNRIDEIIYYKPLREATIQEILRAKLEKLVVNFTAKDVEVTFDEKVSVILSKKCKDPIHNGARLVNKIFRDQIETPLAKEYFKGKRKISVTGENESVKFDSLG